MRRLAAVVVLGVLASACPGGSDQLRDPPRSIAAIGDSITTAAVASREHLGGENPELSWATGTEVDSHYVRLGGTGEVERRNVAVPGARMADGPSQAQQVVASGADYVTVLLGGNDVCAGTPVDELERAYVRTLDTLLDGLPEAEVLVVSVPDVVGLWDLFGDDPRTRMIWDRSGACASVLSARVDGDDREEARRRWSAYNALLADRCDERPRCVHDGGAVAGHQLERDEISGVDRFHPSVEGQRRLADLTWRAWLERRDPSG